MGKFPINCQVFPIFSHNFLYFPTISPYFPNVPIFSHTFHHDFPYFPTVSQPQQADLTPQAGPKGGRAAVLRALVPSPETSPVALELDPWVMMRYNHPKRSKKMKNIWNKLAKTQFYQVLSGFLLLFVFFHLLKDSKTCPICMKNGFKRP